jgi:hypothetical protein
MTDGRRRDRWDETASLMALIANCNRDVKKHRQPFQPADFHPFEQPRRAARGTPITPANIDVLIGAFCGPAR